MPRRLANWLQAYGEYTQTSESPETYHLWVGLSTIAGAAQRKIWMRNKFFYVHSNMYVVLVSPPGLGKKTTAISTGMRMLKDAGGIRKEAQIEFAPDVTSVSAFVDSFMDLKSKPHQSITAVSKELGSLIPHGDREMTTFLVDIFDGNDDWKKRTRARGVELVTKPWLNLIAGTTTDWMGDNISSFATGGGFTARCIFVYEDERILKEGWPEEEEGDAELRAALVNDLVHITTLDGKFTFEPSALAFYRRWYKDASRFPEIDDPRTSSYFERKHVHVLKVAMALSLAEKDDLVLETKDIETAMALLDGTEPGMIFAFANVGKNTYATAIQRILDQIKRAGEPVTLSDLLRANLHDCTYEEILSHLQTLREMGDIRYADSATASAYVAA